MGFDVYAAIKDEAPNDSPTAAGDLHEELWTALLSRSDPTFHNVRLTRGDGGIDGIQFVDAATGEARIYQAKFFKDLKENKPKKKKKNKSQTQTQTGPRQAVLDSFLRAHLHPFACTSWVLLMPRSLSSTDLGWLMGTMKADALAEAAKLDLASKRPDIAARIGACRIELKDDLELERLLLEYLDVATHHLPGSSLALQDQLKREREARATDRSQLVDMLAYLRDEAIRVHHAEALRARTAIRILNQGWSNFITPLQLFTADRRLTPDIRNLAHELELFTEGRTLHGYQCEGVAPGITARLADVHYCARLLRHAVTVDEVGMAANDALANTARNALDDIRTVQATIADALLRLAQA